MQIVICDDIQQELETIRTALDTYAKAHPELHFDIDEYTAAMDVLHAVEKGKTYDIALLDICMSGVLGTDVAEEMIAKCPGMGIIFLTKSDEYAVTAFALNATHYLLNLSIKVGASYVVNLAFVRRISGNALEMHNGVKISIPRRGSEEVQKKYMDFWRKEALK